MKSIQCIMLLSSLIFAIAGYGQEPEQNNNAVLDISVKGKQPSEQTPTTAIETEKNAFDLLTYAGANRLQATEKLLKNGADIKITSKIGLTALHLAALHGNSEMVKLLLGFGADVNARDPFGLSPLHMAAQYGHVNTIEVLLANGADINAKTKDRGLTPLHWAALWGYTEGINTLLDYGADINAHDTVGNTPLNWAKAYKHYDMARMLARYGGKMRSE